MFGLGPERTKAHCKAMAPEFNTIILIAIGDTTLTKY
jgi:hypothetical protein